MAVGCKVILRLFAISLTAFTTQAQLRTQWCDDDHDHDHHADHNHSHALPHPEDFLKTIFSMYGDNASCTIDHDGYHDILHDLGIGTHDDTAPHDDGGHDHATCYDGHDLLHIHNISEDGGLTEFDFIEIAPTFLEQVLHGCVHSHDDEVTDPPPTAGETWGYTILAVLIISAFSLLSVPMARWQNSPMFKYILTVMLALAVGTLAGDAIMHLIPHGLGLHAHGTDDGHGHSHEEASIDIGVWKSFCTCLIILGFLNLQMLFSYLQIKEEHSSQNAVTPTVAVMEKKNEDSGSVNKAFSDVDLSATTPENTYFKKAPESLAWMIVIGDSFHNFADGLAIGAAFTDSWQLGLSTSVAVFCHELPHEFGDVAAMFSVGWTWKRVILMQIVSQSFAFLGLCIGVPVAESSEGATQWILMLAAGMFLYVALCDISGKITIAYQASDVRYLKTTINEKKEKNIAVTNLLSDVVPELMDYFKLYRPVYVLLMINIGVLIGFAIMLVISILEHLYVPH